MLNKKILFNLLYAIALVGAILTCIDMLTEFLNVAQLYGFGATIFNPRMRGTKYMAPFCLFLGAFVVAAVAILFEVFHLLRAVKKVGVVNTVEILLCVVLLATSFAVWVLLDTGSTRTELEYRFYFAFRSLAMTFSANMGILLVCKWWDSRHKKAQAAEQTTHAA